MNEEESVSYWKRRSVEAEKTVKLLSERIDDMQIEQMGLAASNRTLQSRIDLLERK